MFGSSKRDNTHQVDAMSKMLASMTESVAKSKGASTQRLEALAMTITALGLNPDTVKSVCVDWKTITCDGSEELVPILEIVNKSGTSTIL